MRSSKNPKSWRVTRWLRHVLSWCEDHPGPGAIAVLGTVAIGLFSILQSVDWLSNKIWPPKTTIISVEEQEGTGGNYSVTVENPTDRAEIVTEAVFRAERAGFQQMNAVELMVPAVVYDLPFDCSPGVKRVKLNPPFKIAAKDIGAVVFRSTVKMHPCRLFVSLTTNRGTTKEQEGLSLANWRTRRP